MQHGKICALVVAGGLLAGSLFASSSAHATATAEMLSNTCAGCHGTNGVSAGPAMPTIAGLPAYHIKEVMLEFRHGPKDLSGQRHATIMTRVANGYTDEEIELMADFFSKQTWVSAQPNPKSKLATPVNKRLAKRGKKLIRKCGKCHEDSGVSQEDDIPRVDGQWLDYLLIKMEDYKNENITNALQPKKMKRQMNKKSLEELKAIAHYYASQK